ncbi:hypothetical protein [Hoeflea poritis]|uniref:Uncharacterized protein n=1 Tax=Hoeflea poritis TaxID=2993659 RepID=A0ABT4VJB7_9HYPH|nr:hypothetical protein [Hoeflea poritis]MDA4844750.1 hypothetical protein [Hoeflea poritis]
MFDHLDKGEKIFYGTMALCGASGYIFGVNALGTGVIIGVIFAIWSLR